MHNFLFAIYNLRFAICNLQFARCEPMADSQIVNRRQQIANLFSRPADVLNLSPVFILGLIPIAILHRNQLTHLSSPWREVVIVRLRRGTARGRQPEFLGGGDFHFHEPAKGV